jgi:hypothetical protein
MTHDYKRHSTTTLFAALNVLDGTLIEIANSVEAVRMAASISRRSTVLS